MSEAPPAAVAWKGDVHGHLELIDQTLLPGELRILQLEDVESVREAIRSLRVRGAPAIGAAAAFGLVLGARSSASGSEAAFHERLEQVAAQLVSARPTAVNLAHAVERLLRVAAAQRGKGVEAVLRRMLEEAEAIQEENAATCRAMGEVGARLIQPQDGILTHCNTGGLAAAWNGTALGAIIEAHRAGKPLRVFVDETRPLLQGARLTTWELLRAGIDTILICDNTAAQVMREGRIQKVFVGADRIARNGDTANKVGTYGVAVLAKHHGIPFYVVAPLSTFDLRTAGGNDIEIELRSPEEVTEGFGRRTAPEGVKVYSPAFDVTPAELITGIVTDRGLISPVSESAVVRMATGTGDRHEATSA